MAALLREPAGALLQRQQTDGQQSGWEELKTNWNLPLNRGIMLYEGDTIVDPIRSTNALQERSAEAFGRAALVLRR